MYLRSKQHALTRKWVPEITIDHKQKYWIKVQLLQTKVQIQISFSKSKFDCRGNKSLAQLQMTARATNDDNVSNVSLKPNGDTTPPGPQAGPPCAGPRHELTEALRAVSRGPVYGRPWLSPPRIPQPSGCPGHSCVWTRRTLSWTARPKSVAAMPEAYCKPSSIAPKCKRSRRARMPPKPVLTGTSSASQGRPPGRVEPAQ